MIKIQNIYYMLCYAYSSLREDAFARVDAESFDTIQDLFAALLLKGLACQIKRGLLRTYIERPCITDRPRGKILFSDSLKQQAQGSSRLVCLYDTFSENSYMNRILKTTIGVLAGSDKVRLAYKKQLRRRMLYLRDVEMLVPTAIHWRTLSFRRNNAPYKLLMHICYFVLHGLLMTTGPGKFAFRHMLDDQSLYRLYERFVLAYYRRHHPELHPRSTYIDWATDECATEFLPVMKPDILLSRNESALVIDTKYYTHTMQSSPFSRRPVLFSENLYQIFAYVKNKDRCQSGKVGGVLLYAKTDEAYLPDCRYVFSKNPIYIKTLPLDGEWRDITRQLEALTLFFKQEQDACSPPA